MARDTVFRPGPVADPPDPNARASGRSCLRCKTVFDSAWIGERICPRCKGSTSWRNGASAGATGSNQSQSRSGRKGGS
jgi:uncharacterized paraquat-inducible protein A